MASITSMLNEYRIPSVFHPDSGTTVHTVHELDDIPANTQRPGRIETRWKQETQLGSGAFASVRLEKNELTGQLRAVKLIPKDVLDQCDIDYEHELDILVAVKDCTEFVSLMGWFEDKDHIYIAMEYVEHGDLDMYLNAYPAKAKTEAKEITRQILKGVTVLHDKQICHRDLKPKNILIASLVPMRIQIADFGLATRDLSSSIPSGCGTRRYLAPEQLPFLLPDYMQKPRSRHPKAVDVWAVGIILYTIVTSKHPFFLPKAEDRTSRMNGSWGITTINLTTIRSYVNGIPLPTQDLQANNVSSEGIAFVKQLLHVDPGERVSAADALYNVWIIG